MKKHIEQLCNKVRENEIDNIIEWCEEQARTLKIQADDFNSEECFGGYRAFEAMVTYLEKLKEQKNE